jgi:two-component system, NarL family, response regulator DevR
MIRLCVVDDHEIVHDGLRAMAGRETDLEFVGSIRELVTTGSYFDSRLAGGLLRRSTGANQPAFNERELEIVRLIARGLDNHRIGEKVCISPHTVKFHVTAMLRRHELTRRTELVRLAMDLHLIDDA